MRTPGESLWRGKNVDSLVVLILGLAAAIVVNVAAMGSPKWMFFILVLLCGLSYILIIPHQLRVVTLYFFLFLSFSIAVNFHPQFVPPNVFRPINGVVINLYDVPFYLLFLFWLGRLVFNPEIRVRFTPFISILFWVLWGFTVFGLSRSQVPQSIKLQELWTMIQCWLMFILMVNDVNSRHLVMVLVSALLASLVLQCLLGYAQYVTGGHLGLGFFGEAAQGFRSMRMGQGLISRVGGTIGSPNKLALYLGMILPLNFALLFAKLDRRIKWAVLVPIFGMTLLLEILTFSRGGWIGLGVGGTITFYLVVARLIRRRLFTGVMIGLVVITLLATAVTLVSPIKQRLFADDYGTARTRLPMSRVATNIITHNPVLGVGLGNYTGAHHQFDNTVEAISWTFPMPVHNEFLLIGAEQGLPALGIFLILLVSAMIKLFQVGRSESDPVLPFVAIGLFGGLVTWIVHNQFEFAYVMLDLMFWSLMGLAYAMKQIVELAETNPERCCAAQGLNGLIELRQ